MEENTVIIDEVAGATNADIVTELQGLRSEVVSAAETSQALRTDVSLLVALVAVLVIYQIRNVFLSFVKKGGIKGV